MCDSQGARLLAYFTTALSCLTFVCIYFFKLPPLLSGSLSQTTKVHHIRRHLHTKDRDRLVVWLLSLAKLDTNKNQLRSVNSDTSLCFSCCCCLQFPLWWRTIAFYITHSSYHLYTAVFQIMSATWESWREVRSERIKVKTHWCERDRCMPVF